MQAAVELPFDEGMKRERELFTELLTSSESAAQRYYFFAEREAAKVKDVPADTPQREIKTGGIIGAGTMGGGIAMNFANAGVPVTLLETSQEALDRGLKTIIANYENTAKRGGMKAEDVEKRMALIKPTLNYDDLKDADVIIEAVFETMEVKETVFKKLDEVAKPGAILATNTSGLDVNQIASYTKRPGDVIGMHFFSPANVMKLLENVRGKATEKDVIATVMSFSKKIGKIPVLVGVCEGFVGNRMLRMRGVQSAYMMEEGALPQQIDKVIYDLRLPDGPLRDERPRRQRRGLAHPPGQEGEGKAQRSLHRLRRRRDLRTRPFRPEDRRGLLQVQSARPHADPRPRGREDHRGDLEKSSASHAAPSPTRRSWSARSIRW